MSAMCVLTCWTSKTIERNDEDFYGQDIAVMSAREPKSIDLLSISDITLDVTVEKPGGGDSPRYFDQNKPTKTDKNFFRRFVHRLLGSRVRALACVPSDQRYKLYIAPETPRPVTEMDTASTTDHVTADSSSTPEAECLMTKEEQLKDSGLHVDGTLISGTLLLDLTLEELLMYKPVITPPKKEFSQI